MKANLKTFCTVLGYRSSKEDTGQDHETSDFLSFKIWKSMLLLVVRSCFFFKFKKRKHNIKFMLTVPKAFQYTYTKPISKIQVFHKNTCLCHRKGIEATPFLRSSNEAPLKIYVKYFYDLRVFYAKCLYSLTLKLNYLILEVKLLIIFYY